LSEVLFRNIKYKMGANQLQDGRNNGFITDDQTHLSHYRLASRNHD
jgi:hypothetical protein